MNQFRNTDPEWLAHEALDAAGGNTATAVARLRMAVDALMLWQRITLLSADNAPEGPRRG
jgi:hypothetical protein